MDHCGKKEDEQVAPLKEVLVGAFCPTCARQDVRTFKMPTRNPRQPTHRASRTLPPLPPYEPPRDDQIIVWKEDGGKPHVVAIFDAIFASTSVMEHDTYPVF